MITQKFAEPEGERVVSIILRIGVTGVIACAATMFTSASAQNQDNATLAKTASIRNLAPDTVTSWQPDRPAGDDFLPPTDGSPGPVMSPKDRPYVPNGDGRQPTYRIADTSNPILKPWAIAEMEKANAEVRAGKVPFISRERCWPAGVPGFAVYTRVQPIYFYYGKNEITVANELNTQIRHIYMNVPHSENPGHTWYGESVGHYEGDELVVDTIGLNDRTFVDNYRTPHTDKIHVVERFRVIEGGNTLQAIIRVEDPGAFNMPWTAIQRWRRIARPMEDYLCEPANADFFGYNVAPIPTAPKPDF